MNKVSNTPSDLRDHVERAVKKQPSKEQLEIAKKFKSLCDYCFDDILGSNMLVAVFVKIVRTLSHDNPIWYIEAAGPFFWKYRKEIQAHDFDFFINHDYKTQRADWLAMTHGHGPVIADYIMNSVKNTVSKFKDEDPEILIKTAEAMLKLYSRYILECRSTDT